MEIGMLWFDNNPKTPLQQKIIAAATYYRDKYGQVPNTCLVNPKDLDIPEKKVGIINIKPRKFILPGHLWIGIE